MAAVCTLAGGAKLFEGGYCGVESEFGPTTPMRCAPLGLLDLSSPPAYSKKTQAHYNQDQRAVILWGCGGKYNQTHIEETLRHSWIKILLKQDSSRFQSYIEFVRDKMSMNK